MKVQDIYKMLIDEEKSPEDKAELMNIFETMDPFPMIREYDVEHIAGPVYRLTDLEEIHIEPYIKSVYTICVVSLFKDNRVRSLACLWRESEYRASICGYAKLSVWVESKLANCPRTRYGETEIRSDTHVKCIECGCYIERKTDEYNQRRCNTHTFLE